MLDVTVRCVERKKLLEQRVGFVPRRKKKSRVHSVPFARSRAVGTYEDKESFQASHLIVRVFIAEIGNSVK